MSSVTAFCETSNKGSFAALWLPQDDQREYWRGAGGPHRKENLGPYVFCRGAVRETIAGSAPNGAVEMVSANEGLIYTDVAKVGLLQCVYRRHLKAGIGDADNRGGSVRQSSFEQSMTRPGSPTPQNSSRCPRRRRRVETIGSGLRRQTNNARFRPSRRRERPIPIRGVSDGPRRTDRIRDSRQPQAHRLRQLTQTLFIQRCKASADRWQREPQYKTYDANLGAERLALEVVVQAIIGLFLFVFPLLLLLRKLFCGAIRALGCGLGVQCLFLVLVRFVI